MADELDFLDEDDEVEIHDPEQEAKFLEKLKVIEDRCKLSDVIFERNIDSDGDTYGTVIFPAGRKKRKIPIFSIYSANKIFDLNFEKLRFISGYEAICSYQDGFIEVGIKSTRFSALSLLKRINSLSGDLESPEKDLLLNSDSIIAHSPNIRIGRASKEFKSLLGRFASSTCTLRLENIRSTQHDQALEEMRSFADSIFFQIDTLLGYTFRLERERVRKRLPRLKDRKALSISYPRTQYNPEAMSLYMYANSAKDMPLLQYLAFYQSIEFYFPRYSQSEARRRVGNILKNPSFRPHRDDDIDRLIFAVQATKGNGLGSEKEQLKSVINECLNPDDLRSFVNETKERIESLSGKSARYHKIPIGDKGKDLRADVAERIYAIRCKVVHTKNGGTEEDVSNMILPYSDDSEKLIEDIELVRYVSQCILSCSSWELN